MANYFLCKHDDLIDQQPRGFSVETSEGTVELLLLKQHDNIRAYQNHCPHLGIPLNWQPDEFLSIEGTHIQCSTHGALFTMEDGHCIAGPCAGQGLTSLNLDHNDDGDICLQQN